MKKIQKQYDDKESKTFELLQMRIQQKVRSFADFLNNKVNNLSRSWLKACTLILGLVMAFFCIRLIMSPFEEIDSQEVSVDKIILPRDINQNDKAVFDSLESTKSEAINKDITKQLKQ